MRWHLGEYQRLGIFPIDWTRHLATFVKSAFLTVHSFLVVVSVFVLFDLRSFDLPPGRQFFLFMYFSGKDREV